MATLTFLAANSLDGGGGGLLLQAQVQHRERHAHGAGVHDPPREGAWGESLCCLASPSQRPTSLISFISVNNTRIYCETARLINNGERQHGLERTVADIGNRRVRQGPGRTTCCNRHLTRQTACA